MRIPLWQCFLECVSLQLTNLLLSHSYILSLGIILLRFNLCSRIWLGEFHFFFGYMLLCLSVFDIFLFLVHIYVFFVVYFVFVFGF